MSSVTNSSNNSGYYQLSNTPTGVGLASTSNSSIADALLQAFNSSSSSSDSSNTDGFFLDLSPQAQSALSNFTGANNGINAFGNNQSFTLTAQQQKTLTSILAKYKDAPINQDTFNSIQKDLAVAGLGPNQLSFQDQAQNFNPTGLLLNALDGASVDTSGISSSDENTKANNYIQQVIDQWKVIAGAASSASTGATKASTTAYGLV